MRRFLVLFLLCVCMSASWAQPRQPISRGVLDARIAAASSLFFWNGHLWAAADHGRLTLYALDTATAAIVDSLPSLHPVVQDMEEIAQDEAFLYLADVGNNSGSRRNLHVLRYDKASLLSPQAVPDTIWFAYADQYSFEPAPMQTDFDCEALVATDSCLLLFTKQWVSHGATVYALPKTPGRYMASSVASLPVEGLVTGASLSADGSRLVLCGYSPYLQPFLFGIDGFTGRFSDSQHSWRMAFDTIVAQVEGIASADDRRYFLCSEQFSLLALRDSARLRVIDIMPQEVPSAVSPLPALPSFRLLPNPARRQVVVSGVPSGREVFLYDVAGHLLAVETATPEGCILHLDGLPAGIYRVSDGVSSLPLVAQ
ncbi:MAG: T9SS type A sorting domain-containing protein [Bacteroidales bacterium]|nr:T9SS type A sorting domain-containing protein [Bacteroidales bacterium]